MALKHRSIATQLALGRCGSHRQASVSRRQASTSLEHASASTPLRSGSVPGSSATLTAALLLSRPPLLQRTVAPLEAAYHAHTRSLRYALSNPLSESFYFREGSLPLRRYLLRSHEYEMANFGPELAGKAPNVGDIPPEPVQQGHGRDHWEKQDASRGEKSLERWPEEEVYCLIQENGRWTFPQAEVHGTESLDQALERELLGLDGPFGGKVLDSWMVTKKPIGLYKDGQRRTFFLRSHILAGEPHFGPSTAISSWAWLIPSEIEARLTAQGDKSMWQAVKRILGVPEDEDPSTTESTQTQAATQHA